MPSRFASRFDRSDDHIIALKLGASHMQQIEDVLANRSQIQRLPDFLVQRYFDFQLSERRFYNRLAMMGMAIVFDAFLMVQIHTAPEIAKLSGVLRLLVLSPLVFGFVILDMRRKLGKFYSAYIILLAVAPTLISDVLILLTNANNVNCLSDIRSTPLVLMATGLLMRLTPREVWINAIISVASFAPSVIFAACIPSVQDSALILSEIAVAAAAIMLNTRLESRERRVFLLQISAAIGRAAMVARNSFLLEETHTDGLTGVANRRYFDETLATTLRDAYTGGDQLGLMIIDIDHFKKFNDHYGHQGGDDCLRMVATRASQEVRKGDLFARYGGEEFAVILPGASIATAASIAERIRTGVLALNLAHQGLGEGAQVSVSIGVAVMYPQAETVSRQLVDAADANLYAAKGAGRNRVICDQLSAHSV